VTFASWFHPVAPKRQPQDLSKGKFQNGSALASRKNTASKNREGTVGNNQGGRVIKAMIYAKQLNNSYMVRPALQGES